MNGWLAWATLVVCGSSDERVDFARQIRPVLSDKCFRCHGFDPASRQADLRLDERASALAPREPAAAIVPGNPSASLLVRRIRSQDAAERMPPESTHKSLTSEEAALLERWILQGAEYRPHWSFAKVSRPVPPAVSNAEWPVNAIDKFILHRLERQGMTTSPAADAAVLCRRLHLDVIGLPPTIEEHDAFEADLANRGRKPAVVALVDRLLDSPHYGERWGRHWLDQARYADSNGYTVDAPRVAWPYRDWVLRALNDDMPFDRFTVEQLAGDLLPNPTKSQLVATGFHRNTTINQEGGVKPDQFRHEAIVDRVATTGAVWLGLTIACAQCHTHKFDPISHVDYHRLYAVFNGCADANNAGPTVDVHHGEMFGLSQERQADLARLDALRGELIRLQSAEAAKRRVEVRWAHLPWRRAAIVDFKTGANAAFKRLADDSLLTDGNASENDVYYVTLSPLAGKASALRLRALPDPSLPSLGPGTARNGNFILTDLELLVDGKRIRFDSAYANVEQAGYLAAAAIDRDRNTGWAINAANRKASTNARKPDRKAEAVFALKQPQTFASPVTVVLRHDRNKNYLIGRFAFDWSAEAPQIRALQASAETPRSRIVRNEIAALESRLPGQGKPAAQMILRDLPNDWQTYRLERGDFLRPDLKLGPLKPGVPAALAPTLPPIRNRLDLARWLASPDNALTARVAVNRVWLRYFGRGLVATENDFGFQGAAPSHPELLDWLAAEFVAGGWSMKRLHRLILNSATYQQASLFGPQATRDPDNLLLGRQARLRVEAEIVRDAALAASGALDRRLGGPSVYPPQPPDVFRFTQTVKPWPESTGGDRYRRTMYTTFFRSAPFPLLATFDAPDFCVVCTSRSRSNTPLQALAMANDPAFIELARKLAQRAIGECGANAKVADVATRMFRYCLTRAPSAAEVGILVGFWQRERARQAGNKDAELAAHAAVARALFNADEFIVRN